MSEIFPAATVVLVRDSADGLETLILRRNSQLQFAGGVWVFPGGRVDQDDFTVADDHDLAARHAAVRETMEEAGLTITADRLVMMSHWTTPNVWPKRFATWFFIAAMQDDDNHEVEIDGGEIHQHRWVTPAEGLAAHARGEIELLPPTYITLWELSRCATAADAVAYYQARPAPQILPEVVKLEEDLFYLYPGDAGYAERKPSASGERHRLEVTAAGWSYQNTLWD